MGIPFWIGIIWRRANPAAVWVSFISATTVFMLCETGIIEVSLPWEMLGYLTAGLLGALITGYITKPQPKEELDKFFENLKKPVDAVEVLESDNM